MFLTLPGLLRNASVMDLDGKTEHGVEMSGIVRNCPRQSGATVSNVKQSYSSRSRASCKEFVGAWLQSAMGESGVLIDWFGMSESNIYSHSSRRHLSLDVPGA